MEKIEWSEDIKFSTRPVEIETKGYNDWVYSVLPQLRNMVAGPHDDDNTTKIQIGDDKFFYLRTLDGQSDMPGRYGFGSVRTCLSTFQGEKRGAVYFDGTVHLPILAKADRWSDVWMSLTPMEVMSQRAGVKKGRGNVLIGGLGLGWFTRRVLERKQVEKVTVYEIDPAVAAFFGDPLKAEFGDRLEIIIGNVYNANPERFDAVLYDIWQSASGAEYDRQFLGIAADHPNAWAWGEGWRTKVRTQKHLKPGIPFYDFAKLSVNFNQET